MSENTVYAWVAGRRSLFVDGVLLSLEQSCFQVTHSRTNILELLAHNAPPAGKFLCVQIVEASDSAFVETCCSIAYLRKTCPEVVVICIINDPTLDSAPLMAAGSNGCFSGRFTSAELNLLLTLVVCGDIGLSVVAASRKSAGEPVQALPPFATGIDGRPHAGMRPPATSNAIVEVSYPNVSLSRREREVLAGLVNGESNKTLARSLTITEATVKAHVRTIFRKLGAHSRTQAIRHVLDRCPPGASLSDWLVFCGPGHRQENGSFPSS